jgi:adenylate kinase family enzyme
MHTLSKSQLSQQDIPTIQRIAVIGNAGGGKTTMCRKLSQLLQIQVHHIDMIQWKPNWERTPLNEFHEVHEKILAQDSWIIDGFGPMDAISKRFSLADTLILVDYPLAIHYWWSMKRQIKDIFIPRDDLPENCPMLPKTWELIQIIWYVHKELRPQFIELANQFQGEKRIFHLRSPREMKQFLQQMEARV